MRLGRFICDKSGGLLSLNESVVVARLFSYEHEIFHHIVESFSMRLEVTHRIPLYKNGFLKIFQEQKDTQDTVEEALASAHAYRGVKKLAFRDPNDPEKRDACLEALEDFIRNGPPGYNKAMDYVSDDKYFGGRSEFAELNHTEALPHIPSRKSVVWNSFPHAFSGINKVNGRVNYMIKEGSPLAERLRIRGRLLRYKEFTAGLKKSGCNQIRPGKGGHMLWESPSGCRFPIPRHSGSLGKGLVSKIIKQAGLNLSFTQFVNSVKS